MWRAILALSVVALLAAGTWMLLRADERRAMSHSLQSAIQRETASRSDDEPAVVSDSVDRASVSEAVPPSIESNPEDPEELAEEPAASLTGVLAGVVLVDGVPPIEPLELRFKPDPKGAVESLTTDAFGRFRREGLRLDWSGDLDLPRPYRVVLDADSWRSSLPVERLREDLVIEVERGAALRLRVLREDRSPAAGLSVDLKRHDATGRTDDTATTDALGVVMSVLTQDRPALVEVRALADDGANVDARFEQDRLQPSGPYGDIDLGDLLLQSGRQVRFRFLKPDGTPLRDTRLLLLVAGWRIKPETDASGELTLGLPRTSLDLIVEAFGYEPVNSTVPANVSEHRLTLARANLLRVRVVDSQERPWPFARVRLLADRPPFGEGSHFPPGSTLRTGMASSSGRDRNGRYRSEFAVDDAGIVEIPGLGVGVELELEVIDRMGDVAWQERVPALTPVEQRELLVRLTGEPCTMEVRVVDANGAAVAGADVTLRGEGGLGRSISGPTNQEGTVRFVGLVVRVCDVSARAQRSIENTLEGVEPCAGPVTVVLQPGRSLEVDVRDESGRRVSAGWLGLVDLTGGRAFEFNHGTMRFEALPFEPLVLTWMLNGEAREMVIDATQESVDFVVPVLAEVAVDAAAWTRVDRDRLKLRFERLEPDSAAFEATVMSPTTSVVTLLPGRYRFSAEVVSIVPGDKPTTRAFGTPRELLVERDSTQTVVLAP